MNMAPKNKCECGKYKNEYDEFCTYCEPNPETEGYSTCIICKTRKNDNLIFTEPDCPETYCIKCVRGIKSTGNFVCKFCGVIGKETQFANHYTCFDCYEKSKAARLERYKKAKTQEVERARNLHL